MGYLKERVSYLRGLAEGMKIDESTNEGKMIKAILEVLDDVALDVEDIEDTQEQLSEQVDNIDEDLAEIEKIIFDEEEYDDEEYEDEDEDLCFAEIECPHCNEKIHVDSDMIDENDTFECPNCHKEIEVEWDCDCEECKEHEEE